MCIQNALESISCVNHSTDSLSQHKKSHEGGSAVEDKNISSFDFRVLHPYSYFNHAFIFRKRDKPIGVYNATLQFMKSVVTNPNAFKYPSLVSGFDVIRKCVKKEQIKVNNYLSH